MDKVEKAAEWFRSLTERATGRQFAHNEPLVATGLTALGCQQHPFILVRDAEVRAIETALPSAEWRKRIKEQSAQSEKSADETSSVAQKSASANVEKFDPKSTREARELSLQAIVIHELAHDIRGIQVGRTSTSAVRLGLRVNAFAGSEFDKRFVSLTEATAVLAEGRFLVEQGLTAQRNWEMPYSERRMDGEPVLLAWKEFKNLVNKKASCADGAAPRTMKDEFFDLLKRAGLAVQDLGDQGMEVRLRQTKYTSEHVHLNTNYQYLHWGMEMLASEIFQGKALGARDAVVKFHELLLKAEVEAEPKPLFREILNLAKKDVANATSPESLNEREVGKQYLEFFSKLRPINNFDMMVFQGFVRAAAFLPAHEVVGVRADLLKIYKVATRDVDMVPKTNAL
jgi:hypothetical protein